jgi:hypothetical protein
VVRGVDQLDDDHGVWHDQNRKDHLEPGASECDE